MGTNSITAKNYIYVVFLTKTTTSYLLGDI